MTTTTMEFNSVTFSNFPAFIEDRKITGYPLMSAVVADMFAEQIPSEARKAITVDFSKLDMETLMEQAKQQLGIQTPFANEQESWEAEQHLLQILTNEGFFD
ncbi:hypothetical protein [Alicyclobacillus hesperidum]|uniref:hypothetical protein n=1 Tax=Alicyclobacillus hesperidum TaxID=89784 RepID=UPI0003025594|nr:hypothetical protein [Alicyclobacillus hesperidum]